MATIFSCSETSTTNNESLKLDTPSVSIDDLGGNECPSTKCAIFDEFEDDEKDETSRLQTCHLSGSECIKKSILYIDNNIQHRHIRDVSKSQINFSSSSDKYHTYTDEHDTYSDRHSIYSAADDAASDNEKTYSISEASDDEIAVKHYPDSFEESDSCRSLHCDMVADNVSKRVDRCLSSVKNIEESIKRHTKYEDVVGKIIDNYYNLYSKRLKAKGMIDGSSSDSSVSSVRSNSFSHSCCFESSSPDGSICREQTETMSKQENFSCPDVHSLTCSQSIENNHKSPTNDSYRSSILSCWSGTSSRSSINEEETATTTSMYPKSNDSSSSSPTSNDDHSNSGFDNIILEPPDMFKTMEIKLRENEACDDKYQTKVDLNDNSIAVNQYENQAENASVEILHDDVSLSSNQSEILRGYKDDCNSKREQTTVHDNLKTYEIIENDCKENEEKNCLLATAGSNGRQQFAVDAILSLKNDELIKQHNEDNDNNNNIHNDDIDINLIYGHSVSRSTTTSSVDLFTHQQTIKSNGNAMSAFNSAEKTLQVANIEDYNVHLPYIDEDISDCSSIGPVLDEELRNFDPGGNEITNDSMGNARCLKNFSENDTELGWVPMTMKNTYNLTENPTKVSAKRDISKVVASTVDANSIRPKMNGTGIEKKLTSDLAINQNKHAAFNDQECQLGSNEINNYDYQTVEEQIEADANKTNEEMTMFNDLKTKEYLKTETTNDDKSSTDEIQEKYVKNENSKTDEKILHKKNDCDGSINGEVDAEKTSDHDQSSTIQPDALNENSNSDRTSKTEVAQEFHSCADNGQPLKSNETDRLKSDEKTSLHVSNLEAIHKFSDYFEKSLPTDSKLCEGIRDLSLKLDQGIDVNCSFNDEKDAVQVTSFVNSSSDSDLSEDEQQTKDDNLMRIVPKDLPQQPSGILKSKFKQNFVAKPNRVRFDESLNKFFEADYVILIQDDDDDNEDDNEYDQCECDDQYCCDRCYYGEEEEEEEEEDEDEEDNNEKDELNEILVDSPQFDFATAFEPPVDFVDVVTLSPPEKYKDRCGDPDVIPRNTKMNDGCGEETSSKADSKTENSEGTQNGVEIAQKKEPAEKIKSDVMCKNEELATSTSINDSELSTDSLPNPTGPPRSNNTNETPKAIERCIIFDSGVQLNYVEFTPPSNKLIGGILKGGKQWHGSDVRNKSCNINDFTQPTNSNLMPNIVNNIQNKRIVKFTSHKNDSTENRITDDKSDTEPVHNNDFTLTFTLGNLVVPCNSLKPNSAVRQLFPDPRYSDLSASQQSELKDENLGKCEGKFLVTEESLRAFNEVNKRSVFATFGGKERYPGRDTEFTIHSDDEDIPQNNLIRKTIERNTLRRNLTQNARNIEGRKQFVGRKKNSTEPSLEERIKQLTYDIGNEAVNGNKRSCNSDLMLNQTSQSEEESQHSQHEKSSFVLPIPTEAKKPPSVQEARKQFLSSLACDLEISERPGDRLSIISNVSTGTEYSVGDIDEALEKPAKLNTNNGDGAIDSQDELVMFVMQDASRIERIKRRYSSAPASSPSPATSSSDEHDNFSFSRRPSICGFSQSHSNSPIMSRMNRGHLSPIDTTPTLRLDQNQQSFSNGPNPTNILAMQSYDNNFKQSSQSLHLPSPTFGVNSTVSSLPQLRNNTQNQYQNSFANNLAKGYSPPLAKTNRYHPQLINFNYTTAALAYQSLRTSSMQLASPNQLLERGTLEGVTSSPTFERDFVKLSPMQLPRADAINNVQQSKPGVGTVMYGMNV